MKPPPPLFAFGAIWLALGVTAGAGERPADAAVGEGSAYDRIWDLATLYENPGGSTIRKLALTGRLQADAALFDAGDAGRHERLVWRRVRFGFKTSLLHDFTFHAEFDADLNEFDADDLDDTYSRLTDFYVAWGRNERFSVKLGKQSAPFTLDGATSSKNLITLERSTVANNLWFPTEYFTGLAALGELDGWRYHLGAYSASGDPEFGSFESGGFGLLSIGRDLPAGTAFDAASWRFDYVYNDPDFGGDVGTRDLRQVASLVGELERGRLGLRTDLSFGDGLAGQGDLLGLQLMPYYDLSDRWQLVFSYSLVSASGAPGVRLNRYESRIDTRRFDRAHEFFLGLNHYLYSHKLKWQNGIEYTHATGPDGGGGGYSGWGFTSGLRLSW